MKVIAISYTGLEDVIGDIIISGIFIDESQFGKFPTYWSKRKLSIRLYRGLLFEKLGDVMSNMVIRRTKDKKLIPELTFDILNSYNKFWKYPIYLESPYEDIIDLMEEKMSHNLKAIKLNLKDCKFKFSPHKSIALAWAIAEEIKFQENTMNKKIWGSYGNNRIEDPETQKFLKEHKDCVHIRERYKNKNN